MFSRIRRSPDLRITELNLYWDVSMVPTELFARAVPKLEKVMFGPRSRVTADQLKSLLMLISQQL